MGGLIDIAAGSPEKGDDALQTLFEFDPESSMIRWADPAAAARLLASDETQSAIDRASFAEHIVDGPIAAREAAFNGETASYVCEYRLKRDGSEEYWVEERGGWIGAGKSRRLISILRSTRHEKRREKELSWLAQNDELTGLLNRTHLRERLEGFLAHSRDTARRGAYLLAGIDDLGAINADFGFEVADEVIVAIAARLSRVLGAEDRIGRVAGTKFGILIADANPATLRETSIRLMNAVRESVIPTKRGGIAASISIGAVNLPEDAENSQTAMVRAEAALDQAKGHGKSSWASFSETTDVVTTRRRNTHMSDVILTALNERRVRLAFQPIVSDLGEPPMKFECLIRMRAEDGREIPAPEFIPIAERLGLVHLLDRRVLELAVNTLSVCPHIKLNVNVSMETVKDPVWAEGYLAHLRAHEQLAERIQVELTETQVIDAIDASIEFVSELKKLGCSFAIDDFGAGYTSFRNLKALDIDTLKIDGSFVTGVASSRENQLFVRTLLDLARNFGMRTVAEWVDNEADAMLLKGLGVDYLQGYLIGKPEINPEWLPSGAPNDLNVAMRA
ncbi:MAG TPA: bifunctional diguanylate cyclase/phosphodiesterase [Parvularculaceae bacterium]|nr:bifunctional diguanylate cyclase/phosphodiesterase [Parvularculaceae bacterium]